MINLVFIRNFILATKESLNPVLQTHAAILG